MEITYYIYTADGKRLKRANMPKPKLIPEWTPEIKLHGIVLEPIGSHDDNPFDKQDTYPMRDDQPAQIDCRLTDCRFHKDGSCINASPAITLNRQGKFVCWSREEVA